MSLLNLNGTTSNNTTGTLNAITGTQSNDATRLHEIAMASREKTQAQRQYDAFIAQCTDAAENGLTEGAMQIRNKMYFEMLKMELEKRRGGAPLPDDFAEQEYSLQKEVIEILKSNGFTVEIKERSNIILLNEGNDDMMSKYVEADVIIRW